MKTIESWKDITLNQMVELRKLEGKINTLAGQRELMKIMLDVDANEIPFDEYVEQVFKLQEALNKPFSKTYHPTITIDGVQYKAKDIKEFSTREFTDFDSLAREDDSINFGLLLAIIYRPEGEKLTAENYEETIRKRAEVFGEKMDADTAVGAVSFFTKSLLHYLRSTIVSSPAAKEMMEKNPQMKESMKTLEDFLAGDGNSPSTI